MIIAKQISKRFGKVVALDDVSFTIQAGESVAFWGANGAGKTTALRCMLGLHSFEGQFTLNEIDVQKQGKSARRLVGYVPQEFAFYDMSVLETLAFYARLKKTPAERIGEVLEKVQLTDHQSKGVNELSGGLKQRLALAIALLADPPFMLLDEPTASLDTRAQYDFMQMIRDLNDAGKTIIFTSHRIEEVTALANRVLMLVDGKLTKDFTPADLSAELGLRQWLRIEIADSQQPDVHKLLDTNGFTYVQNGAAVYVNVTDQPKFSVLQLLENGQIPIQDFEIADSFAVSQLKA